MLLAELVAFSGICYVLGNLDSLFFFFSGHTSFQYEFPMALIDDFRNNRVLLNGVIYKEKRKLSEEIQQIFLNQN